MARFFGKPSINDHLDDLIGSWFGNTGTQSVRDHGSKPPHDDGQDGGSNWPDPIPPDHDDGPDFPPVGDFIKFWLHKVFGGHHHNPPPDGNDAPQIIDAEQTGQIPEGDSTELLTVAGAIRFTDKDFGDTHTATVEFVSTTDPSGMEYGALEADINPNFAEGAAAASWGIPCPSPTKAAVWTYAVNDADIQQLAEGEEVLQTYRVTVTDAAGAQDSQLVTIRLQGSNDEPTASAVALVVDANAPAEIPAVSLARGPLAATAFVADDVDSDDNQSTLTYELLGQPSGGTVTNNNDGTFSFDPGHDFDDLAEGETRDVTVSYHAIDSHGAISNEATITITVRGVGGTEPIPPVANPDSNPTDAVVEAGFDEATGVPVGDATAAGNALDNDTGQGVSVVGVVAGLATGAQTGSVGTAVAGTFGTLTLRADGGWDYALDDSRAATDALASGQVAHDVFSYTIADDNGETSTTTLIVAITGSADPAAPVPPRAVADINVDDAVVEAGTTTDGTPIPGDAIAQGNALANDEGQGLVVVGVAAGPLGATPGAGVGDTIQGTYGTLTLRADGHWDYALDNDNAATDALGQGQQATDVFSYTVQDPSGQTSTAQVFVVISGSNDEVIVVNTPPTANPDANDGDAVIEAGIDANGDPTEGDPTAMGNVLTNDTDPDLAIGDMLRVVGVTFGAATGEQSENVGDVIDGTYGTLTLDEFGKWTYTLDNDRPETEALAQGQQATEVFTYTISDKAGARSTTTLSIVVTGSDDAIPNQDPDAVDDDVVATSATDPLIINVLENDSDPDGDQLSIVATSIVLPAGVTGEAIDANSDGVLDAIQLAPTPGDTFPESFQVQYTISDGNGGTDTATVNVTVLPAENRAPTIGTAIDDQTTAEEASFSFVLPDNAFTDPDGDTLTYSATLADGSPLPTWLHFDPDPAGFVGIPDDPDLGTIDVKVRATDPLGEFAEQIFRLTVTPVNDAPVANDDPITVAAGTTTPIDVLANDTDIEGDDLHVTGVGAAMNGTAEFVDLDGDGIPETVRYTPNDGFAGTDAFTYDISDGNGGTDTATVNVTVTPPDNVAPVANDDPTETSENNAVEIRLADLIANDTDSDGDSLTVTAINGVLLDALAEGGTIDLTSGATLVRTSETTFDYVPGTVFDSLNPGETAADQFSYSIADGRGGESSAVVTVTIHGENDAPVAFADTATAASPGPQTLIYFAATGPFLDTGGGRELYAFNPETGALALVTDVNGTDLRLGSDPQELTPLNGKLYFVAQGSDVGYELFVYNPATNETKVVADLFDGPDGSFPSELTVVDGKLYFQAYGNDADGETGSELYVVDPATDQATLVKDINPGPDSSSPNQLIGLDGKVYFFADDEVTGRELHVLNPETGEVSLVADLNEGPNSAQSSGVIAIDDKLYFAARDNTVDGGDFGVELFVYDPSSGQPPARLTDLNPDAGSSSPVWLTELDGKLYFAAYTVDNGQELYVYDPGQGTTTPLPEASPGPDSSDPEQLTTLDGKIYFTATAVDPDTGDRAQELYVYDPNTGMSTLIPGPSDSPHGSSPQDLTVLDGRLFFTAEGSNATDGDIGRALYVYDPAGNGDIALIADLDLGNSGGELERFAIAAMSKGSGANLTVVDGKLYFSAVGNNDVDGNVGQELYVYDPATDTTTLAADVNTDPVVPRLKVQSAAIGTDIYFVSPGDNETDGNIGIEPYVLDTLTGETKPLIDLLPGPSSSNPTQFTVIDDKLYFAAAAMSGYELYVHDPATGTTTLITDPTATAGGSNPKEIVGVGGKVYFTAEGSNGTTETGRELYVYDPTSGNPPALVADLNDGPDGSSPVQLTAIGGKLYFVAEYNDGTASAGRELFVLDPTDDVPILVDVNAGSTSSFPDQLTEFDGKVYFTAQGSEGGVNTGRELYVLTPATNEATLVADLNSGTGSSFPGELTVVGDKLYFRAQGNDGSPDGNVGSELYVIDPAVSPVPTLVADLNPGSNSSSPSSLTALGDKLYFTATGPDGNELYVIDPESPTNPTTPVLVADLSVGGGSFPGQLTVLDGTLYFVAEGFDGTDSSGAELYFVDPATGRAELVPEAYAGEGSSDPSDLTAFNGKIYFSAEGNNPTDGAVGRELYVYDPVAKTTTLVADLNIAENPVEDPRKIAAAAIAAPSGANGGSNPTALTVVDGKLYFTAAAYNETDGLAGQAIYVIDPTVSETPVLVADVDTRTTADSTPRELTELTADGLPEASGNVLANDTNVDTGDTLMVVGVQSGALSDPLYGNVGTEIDGRYGTLVLNTDGSWTYVQDFGAPAPDAPQTDVFSYTIADSSGETSTTTLTIDVVPRTGDANRAPVANDDATQTGEDDIITIKLSDFLANDRDPDGDTLTVTALGDIDLTTIAVGTSINLGGKGGEDGAILTRIDADTFTLDPNGGFDAIGEGQTVTEKAKYTVSDGHSGTATGTWEVTIAGANDDPVATDDVVGAQTDSNSSFDVLANDSDVDDGDELQVVGVSTAMNGTTTLVDKDGDGVYERVGYTPNAGFTGIDTFTYDISDGHGGTDTATVTVGVGLPVIVGDSIEDNELSVDLANLPVTQPVTDATYQWLVDGVPITGANAPTFTPGDAEVGATISVRVSVNESGDTLLFTSPATAPVENVNDDPIGVPIIDGTAQVGIHLSVDPGMIVDDDGLGDFSFQWQASADGKVWTPIDGATEREFVPDSTLAGQQLRVVVSYVDGHGTPEMVTSDATAAVVPGGADVNDAPEGADATLTVAQGESYTLTRDDFGFSDPNDVAPNEFLAVTITTLPTAGTLTFNGAIVPAGIRVNVADIDAGQLVFTQDPDATGAASFTFQVQDDGGTENGGVDLDQTPNTITFDIGGGGENQPPRVSLVSALTSLPEDTDTSATSTKVADIVIMDDGIGDNQLSLAGPDASLFTIVQTGTVSELHLREGAVLSFQDNPILDVTVEVDDPALGTGPEDSAPLSVQVIEAGANLAPFADDDFGSGQAGETIIVNVLDGDVDTDGSVDPASVQIEDADTGSNGQTRTVAGEGTWAVIATTGQIMFTPEDPGFTGPVTPISYTVADNEGLRSNLARVIVTIDSGGGNEAPVVGGIDEAALAYTENDPATAVASGIMVSDDGNLVGATIAISGYVQGEDFLALASPPTGISAVFDEQLGILTLSGTADAAAYEQALRTVSYENTSDDPITMARTLTFSVDDGVNVSDPVTRDVAVMAVNDMPAVVADPGYTAVVRDAVAVAVFPELIGLDASTVEAAETFTAVTLEVTNVANSGEELIIGGTAVALEDGVTELGGAEARVTVVGSTATVEITNLDLTQAQLEATLRDVSYANTATAPTGGVREIALTSIRDSGGSDNGGMDVAATDVRSSVLVRAGAQVGGSGEPLAVSTPEDAVYVLGREDFSAAIGMTNFEGVAFNLNDSDGDGTADYLDLNPTDPAISEAGRFGILFVDRDADNVVDAGEIIGIGGQEVVTAAQLDAGMVKFAGLAGMAGVAQISVEVLGATSFASDTLTLEVSPAQTNSAPVAQDDTASTTSGVAVVVDVLANDTDADGNELTITNAADAIGSVEIGDFNEDGIPDLLYRPAPGFTGVDTFSYAIDDGNGGTDIATASVVVAQEVASTPDTPTLDGHIGPDRFVYHLGDGPVTITNFEPGPTGQGEIIDQIEISGFQGLDFNTLDSNEDGVLDSMDAAITGDQSGITLHLGTDDALTVANVTALDPDDLLFS